MSNDGFLVVMALVLAALLGILLGADVGERRVENTCEKSGALIINNKLYECRLAETLNGVEDIRKEIAT
jgi:hypothetical protein